jgi:hypothetical protein
MEGYWSMLNSMSADDPKEYENFVKTQMGEMKDMHKVDKVKREEKFNVQSEPFICFSCKPAKIGPKPA